ncbi:MAG: ethylbenzene dehydrogenase-related protein [Nevskia sp.]|nr:ethylbenzene dehydrogenase-related protein [Nevskia sp.]
MNHRLKVRLAAAGLCLAGATAVQPAQAAGIDWSGVKGQDINLFYPGQSSWEWVLTPADHSGAPNFKSGKDCRKCHTGDEPDMGKNLVSGKKNEASPIAGKPGSMTATVKFAHDASNLYVHLDFDTGTQPDAGQDKKFETKVTMMLNDGGVPEANRTTCWVGCHEDLTNMPGAGGASRTMYLMKSREKMSRQGGGDAKSADELAKLKAAGYYLEYDQARLNPGKPAAAESGTILDKREPIADNKVTAEATGDKGHWSVTIARPLHAGGVYKDIVPGKTYTVGFAVHAGHTEGRFHYVSFERTLVLDSGAADFVAAGK